MCETCAYGAYVLMVPYCLRYLCAYMPMCLPVYDMYCDYCAYGGYSWSLCYAQIYICTYDAYVANVPNTQMGPKED